VAVGGEPGYDYNKAKDDLTDEWRRVVLEKREGKK
jgi:hypothetical protein